MMNGRTVLRSLAAAVCLAAFPTVAAGTCAPGIATAQERMKGADAVFVGRIVKIRGPSSQAPLDMVEQGWSWPLEVEFEVRMAWKGVRKSRVLTINNNTIFPADLHGGPEYLVFAYRSKRDGRLEIMGCGNVRSTENANQDIHDLGAPEYVYQAPVPANHGSQPTVGAPSIRTSCSIRTLRAACG